MIEDREEYIKPNAIASNAAGDIISWALQNSVVIDDFNLNAILGIDFM